MRLPSFALLALLLTAVGAAAQTVEPPPPRAPALSLNLGGAPGLPRLGIWKPVTDRLTLGLEVESDFMSRSFFPGGDRSRRITDRDWRFAVGPSATFRLARSGDVSLLAYGGASYGSHAFDVANQLGDTSGPARPGLGIRGGLALDWKVSDHWTVGALQQWRWTSEPGRIGDMPREGWWRSGLGLTVKFRF